uniref:Twitching motility protein PilT n=1 Tax=Candidatus Kentrum eta TaxID=2126337 RepID=A0A450UXF7_9GAMM|nr:MAG: twitching motility protein PilT [Candidatus Kentron sp. H]VFJ89757.1 MAG: twitching motility protein PilT [Candidatus Kentron sp. H]VFJ97199.1 MAG: twitching motility protein PilT [Candidatus Kentron sp. H]
MNLQNILRHMVAIGASDFHLAAGSTPLLRIDGDLQGMEGEGVVSETAVLDAMGDLLPERFRGDFDNRGHADFAFEYHGIGRFRANAFKHLRGASLAIRSIPQKIPTLEALACPPIIERIAGYPNGLVLVTGPTGSGKSTTLAAMIDHINRTRRDHILTIEDPIEFVHPNRGCLLSQREVHEHTEDFSGALRAALREDPDVILVGEMRDMETVRLAMTAAETGHLVLATLHTVSAPKTMDRIIGVFPSPEQPLARAMLSESLRAVISQVLCKKHGGGRVAAWEILLSIPAVRNLIAQHKVGHLYSVIQTNGAIGMTTLKQSVDRLLQGKIIDESEAARVLADSGDP